MKKIQKVVCVGCGVIGAGWAARLTESGIDVAAYDLERSSQKRLNQVIKNAQKAYQKLYDVPQKNRGTLTFSTNLSEVVKEADLIIESVPERIEIKQDIYSQIENYASSEAIIASSTSGIKPSELQKGMLQPERLLVSHPFNPVYLIPMVEVIGGALTTQKNIKIVCDFYDSIFMKPVHLKKEIDAFVADRLLEAIWRESLWLIKDGICTTQELDDIVKYGFGLRYAQMGVFETYRIAGGDGGMRKHLENFGPCLKWPWTKLTDVPDLNEDLIELIVSQSDQQSKGKSIQQLEELRDDNLVEIQKGLKSNNSGVGKLLNKADKALKRRSHTEIN